jgi:aminoglycoside phosphotransferase family enzyme/predicted kinase
VIPELQRSVAALLGRLTGAAPIETHISAVFVGPDAVLKLKKAVDLGFLDFTAIEARERFARRELEVNRRFAPGLYRDVVPVVRRPDGTLDLAGTDGETVDWVLRMAPVPAADFLDAVAARGGLSPALLDETADAVAAMHGALPAAQGIDPVAPVAAALEGTRRAALAAGLPAERVQDWAAAAAAALAGAAALLAARHAAGRVRRCHGDLHLKNLCLWEGRVTLFDALEFDEALATIDTGYDLAFLVMDLWRRLGRPAANRVLNRYVARTGDAGLVGGLPVWLSLRAAIRAHAESGEAGLAYFALAEAALRRPAAAPCLVAIGGLPGTGKSRLARALAPGLGAAPGALVLRSDEIRKRRHAAAPEQRLPPAAYTPAENAAVFAELAALAGEALRVGRTVVADAAFLRPDERAAVEAAAAAAGAPFHGIWLRAPLKVLRARVAARIGDASDATVAVVDAAAARDPGPLGWPALDATVDPLPAARTLLGSPPVVP